MSTITVTEFRPAPRAPRAARRPGEVRAAPRRDAGQPARPAPGQLRLTRRGRIVLVLGALLLLLAAAFFAGAGSVATERPGVPEPTQVVVVEAGDTLWAIAAERATDGDVRDMVDRIERLNALESAMVQVGQRLRVPVTDE